jgi:hypothetical protein
MKGDMDDIKEKRKFYEHFLPIVIGVLKILKEILFSEMKRKYIIRAEFVYPKEESFIGSFFLERKNRKETEAKDRIIVSLVTHGDIPPKLEFYVKVYKEINLGTVWAYTKISRTLPWSYNNSSKSILQNFDSKIISKILLRLVFNLYVDFNLFSKNKKQYALAGDIIHVNMR